MEKKRKEKSLPAEMILSCFCGVVAIQSDNFDDGSSSGGGVDHMRKRSLVELFVGGRRTPRGPGVVIFPPSSCARAAVTIGHCCWQVLCCTFWCCGWHSLNVTGISIQLRDNRQCAAVEWLIQGCDSCEIEQQGYSSVGLDVNN
uniref:Predicted protein n=1 Tax=Physcomitrium patens TaxID=3218 RepID=A9U3Z0_PHYPA